MILNENDIRPLHGLVLAGGKSMRMGAPKEQMLWHGKEQHYYAADMLTDFCDEVFISCRADQQKNIDAAYRPLPDSFLNMGPLGGILSAFRFRRDCAWLVIACDLPLLNLETISYLKKNRNVHKIATAYESPHDHLPEPLIAIWEPAAYPALLAFLASGITCPRKTLVNSEVEILKPLGAERLMNVNTPEEAAIARDILQQKIKAPNGR